MVSPSYTESTKKFPDTFSRLNFPYSRASVDRVEDNDFLLNILKQENIVNYVV